MEGKYYIPKKKKITNKNTIIGENSPRSMYDYIRSTKIAPPDISFSSASLIACSIGNLDTIYYLIV